jgi:radical SAM protein with 4Fe4S-binding SPASM domain
MCTYDAQEQYILGDLNHEPFKRIWSGQAARRYRRQFHSDWEGIALCKNCSYAYEGGSCIDEIIASVEFLDPESKPQASEQREER